MNQKRYAELSTALQVILATLIHEYRSEKIILFGSLAASTVGEWSDIDLAIIKKTPKPFVDRSVEAALLCRALVGVDYLVYTPTEFAQLIRDQNPIIIEEIVHQGKVLHERGPN